MPLAPVIASQLTAQDRSLVVYVGGRDITADVQWNSLAVEDSGANVKSLTRLRVNGAIADYPEIYDQALLQVFDSDATNPSVFKGYVRSRRPAKTTKPYDSIDLIADDASGLLDDIWISVSTRLPETMQARIGHLWGWYGSPHLSGDLSFVAAIGGTLPLQRFETVTLRQAIEMTIAQAASDADYYVDAVGRLHVFQSEVNNAPMNIDADAPGGGEVAPKDLDIDYDSNSYANRVMVKGATPEASGYFSNGTAIAAANGVIRTAILQAPDCTTAAMAQSLADMYLGRVDSGKGRGTFTVTSDDADGWRAGQNVLVTSADLGLSAQSYRISRVNTSVLRPGPSLKRQYAIEFGGARAGLQGTGGTPLIAGNSGSIYMLDQLGNSIISNAASASIGGIGPVARRYVTTGLYNGDFYAPPPGPDAPVDNSTNPLPYWSFTLVSGTAVSAMSTADATTGSGRVLTFAMAAGAAGDEGYVEQIIPVSATYNQSYMYRVGGRWGVPSISNAFLIVIATQYLKVDGVTTTGTAEETTNLWSGSPVGLQQTLPLSQETPSDAYYLRIRLGIRRGAAANGDSGSIALTEVIALSTPYELAMIDAATPATYGFTRILQNQGTYSITPGYLKGLALTKVGLGLTNTHVLKMPQGCIAVRSGVQSIANNTWTAIQMNGTDESDPFAFHDPASNNTRFIIPTGWGGTYLLIGNAGHAVSAVGNRGLGWGLNGAAPNGNAQVLQVGHATHQVRQQISTVMELAAGDYVELMAFQTVGVNNDVESTARGQVYYIGETA